MDNANIQYELFVKEIYEYLHQAEGVNNIQIQHNTNLKGISGCHHQIDVYWKFEIAGVEYQVAIECKNYRQKVSIGKIRDFNSALEDIGNINGIFVAKNGFQRGAKEFAKQKKIKLVEMRQPNDDDWKGRMRNLHFKLNAYFKHVKARDIKLDEEWLKNQNLLKPGDTIVIAGQSDEIHIENLATGEITNFYDLENSLPTEEIGVDFQKKFIFEDAYILESSLGHKVRVKSITYTYDVSCSTTNFKICGDDVAKAIVKDVLNGNEQFVDVNGNVQAREPILNG